MVVTGSEVTGIVLENGAAVGVRIKNGRGGNDSGREFRAPIVISNAGISNTFEKLLPLSVTRKAAPGLDRLVSGCSAVTLYLGLKGSPKVLGVKGENYWINESMEHGDMAGQTEAVLRGAPRRCFVSFPSLRNGSQDYHTAEIIACVDYGPFRPWEGGGWRKNAPQYAAVKQRISEGLLSLADRHLPGLKDLVGYQELSTPLSMQHFSNRPLGAMYGYRPDRTLFGRTWFRARTPVKGLYLAGSDLCTMGVAGGLMGGVACASAVIGRLGLVKIVGSAKKSHRQTADHQAFQPPGQ
jgi:phytoene dehydrogenase-like protein